MTETMTVRTEGLKDYLNTVVETSYELGILFAKEEKNLQFTKEEGIKRIQDEAWRAVAEVMNQHEVVSGD